MSYSCPVPCCRQRVLSAKLLLRHLDGVVRRNRCGIYTGTVIFQCCVCHETAMSISDTRVHLSSCGSAGDSLPIHTVHSDGDVLALDGDVITEDPEEELPVQFLLPTYYCPAIDADNFQMHSGYHSEDEEGELRFLYNSGEEEPLSLNTTGQSDEDGGSESDNEDVSRESTLEVVPSDGEALDVSFSTMRLVDFDAILETTPRFKLLFELYQYCSDAHCTHKSYLVLRKLSVFNTYPWMPRSYKTLRNVVRRFIEQQWIHGDSMRLVDIGVEQKVYRTPFLSISDALKLWLSVPAIVSSIRKYNSKYLPNDLLDVEEYDRLIQARVGRIRAGVHLYETVADGDEYLDNIRQGIPLFACEVRKAQEEGLEVLVLNFGLYEDIFAKNINSIVIQTIFCLTLIEATTGEASLTDLSTLIIMLADAVGNKALGDNDYWKVFVGQLQTYQSGVRVMIHGTEYLIICFTLLLLGDTPALKAMCGYSPSVSAACYVRMPCRCCDIIMGSLYDSINDVSKRGVLRTLAVLQDFYKSNGGRTGVPHAAWLVEQMKRHGFLKVPELIRLHLQPSPIRMGIDFMHHMYLGVLRKHFIKLVKILTSGLGSRRDANSIWQKLSCEFAKHCRVNGVSAFCNFSNKKEFKMRMTAGSMKEFAGVSSHILLEIDLMDFRGNRDGQRKQRAFHFWCVHVKIASILNRHQITTFDLCEMDVLINSLLQYFVADFPKKFFTINVHYYVHLVDQIKALGNSRFVSNFGREALIRKLKPFYRNTNFHQKECSIFERYVLGLFFQVTALTKPHLGLEFRKDSVCEGLVGFDFSVYSKVTLEVESEVKLFFPLRFQLLTFVYDNLKTTRTKLHYEVLRSGNYILLAAAPTESSFRIGVFVAVMKDENEKHMLAFTTPMSCVEENNADYPLLKRVRVDGRCGNEVSLVSPGAFICRLQVFPSGDEDKYLLF